MTALLLEIFLFSFGVAYELQLVSYGHKIVPQYARCSCLDTSLAFSGCGANNQAPSRLLNMCFMSCNKFASNQPCIRVSMTFHFLYLLGLLEDRLVQQRTLLRINSWWTSEV